MKEKHTKRGEYPWSHSTYYYIIIIAQNYLVFINFIMTIKLFIGECILNIINKLYYLFIM